MIKCHLFIRFCFRLGNDGWNCVTKGKMRLFSLRFNWRACFLGLQSSLLKALCKKNFWITPVEEFFFEVFSVFSSKGSPFTKPLFKPGGWHGVKCVYWKVSVGLKFVCKSSAESQFFKSFGFAVYGSIQERRLCFRYFSRKSNCGEVFISLLNELSYFLSTDIPYWKKYHPWIFSKRAVLCRFG